MISFAEATLESGMEVLSNVRGAQRKTIDKLGVNAEELLARAIGDEYPTFVVSIDGEVAAIFGGTSETILGEVRLWMLTTPRIEQRPIALLRYSRRYVQWMYGLYGPVIGVCDCDFPQSRAWLRWIGFEEISVGDYIVMRYSGGH